MQYIADFHMHSPYSRATSKEMTLENLDIWANKKGMQILGMNDFTHPLWLKEIKKKVIQDETGLYKLKEKNKGTYFIPTSEISSIYKKGDKCRRIHTIIVSPDLETAEKIGNKLEDMGCNIRSDGRPIVGLEAKELAKIALDINDKCLIIPAHIWTPWFSLYGSQSGFDKIKDCFEEMTKYIYAVETGLSAGHEMCWRIKELDNITLLSNSDSHSPPRIGRECNVFDFEKLSYDEIYNTIKNKDTKKFKYTINFFPEEGRYHYDGHAKCGVCLHPSESLKIKNICPKCGKELVIGVLQRVEKLATRPAGKKPPKFVPYKNLVQLEEVISDAMSKGVKTKTVQTIYEKLVNELDNEFNILLNSKIKDIENLSNEIIAEGIKRLRAGKVKVSPGYDGEYGKIEIFSQKEKDKMNLKQNKLL